MISFRTARRGISGDTIVEIWRGSEIIGSIYPSKTGIHVVSFYFANDPISDLSAIPPASYLITFGERRE